jgi:hypothetical protein
MKIHVAAVALIASLALALPAEAATKKRKKQQVYRVQSGEVYSRTNPHPHDVWFANEYIGRDPDPNIRALMIRNPRMYDSVE